MKKKYSRNISPENQHLIKVNPNTDLLFASAIGKPKKKKQKQDKKS